MKPLISAFGTIKRSTVASLENLKCDAWIFFLLPFFRALFSILAYRLGVEFEEKNRPSFDKKKVCIEQHKSLEVNGDVSENNEYDDSLDCLSVFTSFMRL